MHVYIYIYIYIHTYILRGWQNTVGSLIELFWLKKNNHGPQFIGICAKNRGVRFHRIRGFARNIEHGATHVSGLQLCFSDSSPIEPTRAASLFLMYHTDRAASGRLVPNRIRSDSRFCQGGV